MKRLCQEARPLRAADTGHGKQAVRTHHAASSCPLRRGDNPRRRGKGDTMGTRREDPASAGGPR